MKPLFAIALMGAALLTGMATGWMSGRSEAHARLDILAIGGEPSAPDHRVPPAWRRRFVEPAIQYGSQGINDDHYEMLLREARDIGIGAGEQKAYREAAADARDAWIGLMEACRAHGMAASHGHPALARFVDLAELRFEKAIWEGHRFSRQAGTTELIRLRHQLVGLEERLESLAANARLSRWSIDHLGEAPAILLRDRLMPRLAKLPLATAENLLLELTGLIDEMDKVLGVARGHPHHDPER